MKEPEASIITTCKGRLHHLRQSIIRFLSQKTEHPYEIIVVDYGDQDNCAEWVNKHQPSIVRAVKVEGKETKVFQPSHARNIGGVIADGKVLAFIDADVLVSPLFYENVIQPVVNGAYDLMTCDDQHEVIGSCVVSAAAYHAVRGYGEDLLDWGYQDHDFYNRVRKAGFRSNEYSSIYASALENSTVERVANYAHHRIGYTSERNKKIAQRRSHEVNPDGYGRASGWIYCHGESPVQLTLKRAAS